MIEQTQAVDRPWLKSYDADVPHALNYENVPLFEYLHRAAKLHPKRTAIIFMNYRMTYAKLKDAVQTMAANLRAEGVSPGDRVSIMLPNLPQTIISFWAALEAGATVVMTNPLYMEKELVHQMQDSGAKFMITLDHLWPKIEELKDKLGLRKYFVTSIPEGLKFPLNKLYGIKARRNKLFRDVPFDNKSVLPWKKLLKGGKRHVGMVANPSRDIAMLQYTGGTTGIAKGVMLTHSNLTANVQQIIAVLHKIGEKHHTFLSVLPFFHVFGMTVCLSLATSMAATILPLPRFVPKDVLDAIKKHKPTIFPGAPSVYTALMQQKDIAKYNLSSVEFCISGSAPCPVETIRRFKELTGAEIVEGYGLTEASPVTHVNPLAGKKKHGSIGLPFPDTEAMIVDSEVGSIPLDVGKVGELVLKGPQVMHGYWNRPDDTAGALRNGWLYTGDIATMDEEGYFYIVDRKKDMIISGGYNVYPREIDEVLHEHPKVKEAVAVGIPHPSRGEIIKAYIVVQPGQELTKAEILNHCRKKLANYKIPKQVEFRDELPKTIVGKVLRRTLRTEEEDKYRKTATPEEQAQLDNSPKGGQEANVAELEDDQELLVNTGELEEGAANEAPEESAPKLSRRQKAKEAKALKKAQKA